MMFGEIRAADAAIDAGEIAMGEQESGSHAQGYFERLNRAFEPTQARKDGAELEVGFGKFMPQTNRKQGMIDSLFDKVLPWQRHAQAVVSLRQVRIYFQRPAKGAFGVSPSALAKIKSPEISLCDWIIRRNPLSLFKSRGAGGHVSTRPGQRSAKHDRLRYFWLKSFQRGESWFRIFRHLRD